MNNLNDIFFAPAANQDLTYDQVLEDVQRYFAENHASTIAEAGEGNAERATTLLKELMVQYIVKRKYAIEGLIPNPFTEIFIFHGIIKNCIAIALISKLCHIAMIQNTWFLIIGVFFYLLFHKRTAGKQGTQAAHKKHRAKCFHHLIHNFFFPPTEKTNRELPTKIQRIIQQSKSIVPY